MASRLAILAPRLIALIVIWLLAAASWTLAAGGPQTPQPSTPAAGEPTTDAASTAVLVSAIMPREERCFVFIVFPPLSRD